MGLAIARALTRRCGFELVSSELGGVPGTAPATVVETARPTAHSDPTYVEDGVIPYCVANVAVPLTPTHAITNVTLPFIARLAGMGVARSLAEVPVLRSGLNVAGGHVTHERVAEAHDLPYVLPTEALALATT